MTLPPDYDDSPTVAFLHVRVLALLTALPALLVSHVPGLGPNGILDYQVQLPVLLRR